MPYWALSTYRLTTYYECILNTVWNVNRPFTRCGCPLNGPKEACTRKMIWFGHAVWCMIHNLDVFFPAKGHLCSKYAALIGWLETAARDVVKASVIFAHIRSLMIEGALEYATNPKSKLLSKHGEGAGIINIERMIRPSSNARISHATNLSFKRALPDLNQDSGSNPHKHTHNFGRGHGFTSHQRPATKGPGRGRGSYNHSNHRRFGATGSFAIHQQQNGTMRVRNAPYGSKSHREPLFHSSELHNGVDGSSGGSNMSTISTPTFGRNISWE